MTHHDADLLGRRVPYVVRQSSAARALRLRVGVDGVEVILPSQRPIGEAHAFLTQNETWVVSQLRRVERLRTIRRHSIQQDEILFRGVPTKIFIETTEARRSGNVVSYNSGEILVQRGAASRVPVGRSLENWLRRQARADIEQHLASVTIRLRQSPCRVYVMGQRTKWGNCSGKRNLSFNWRLVLAPEFVLRYLVTHEAVHLAVPDHSSKFWLTVQSMCIETERAKQWLAANGSRLRVELIDGGAAL